jgi:flagellar assembly factor FliW
MKNSVYKNKGRQIYLCSCKGSRIFCFAKNNEANTSPRVELGFLLRKNKEVCMQVDTRWFGTVDIDDNKIVTFELGIIGFEDCKKFTLIYDVEKGDEAAIMWLQSLDEAALALPVMKPEYIMKGYDPVVEDEILNTLGEDIQSANLAVFCTLTVPEDLTKMTINLKAPIIINADTMKGVQLIADNEDYAVRYPIYDILNERKGE